MKDIAFLGTSLDDIRDFPDDIRQDTGYQLHLVQIGKMPNDFKYIKMMTYKSVFDALSDTPIQSANLKLKAQMMAHIQAQVATLDGTQAQIAKQCGITQPRLNDLINGKMSKFSLDALVNINANLGVEVGLVFA